jgi:hypothetical protein
MRKGETSPFISKFLRLMLKATLFIFSVNFGELEFNSKLCKSITKDDLARHNGKHEASVFIAFKGIVYDLLTIPIQMDPDQQ